MVNYRRLLCEVALLSALMALASSAPTPDCTHKHYDQRQNGSENYRVNIDGIFVAVAPAESLFSALGDMDDLMELLALEEFGGDHKPKPPSTSSSPSLTITSLPGSLEGEKPKPEEKPVEDKPSEEKPLKEKPQAQEAKPEEAKPEVPVKPAELPPLSDVSLNDDWKAQKKAVSPNKQEKANRLKNRIAAFLMPLLRKTRHQ